MTLRNFSFKNRTVLLITGVTAFFVIAYFVIIPTVVARQYLNRLHASIVRAHTDVKAVSTGPDTVIFQDPDVSLEKRQTLIANNFQNIQTAQNSLDDLQRTSGTLTRLPGNGFMGAYHTALVHQERAETAVWQSKQVLDDYKAALTYIHTYTDAQLHLDNQLRDVNNIRDFGVLEGQGSVFTEIAANIQASQQQLAALTPPPDFAPLHTEVQQTLSEGANAFQRLGIGLNRGDDEEIYGAVATLERLSDQEDVGDKELIVSLARSSPTLVQLSELPEKIEHVEQ